MSDEQGSEENQKFPPQNSYVQYSPLNVLGASSQTISVHGQLIEFLLLFFRNKNIIDLMESTVLIQ